MVVVGICGMETLLNVEKKNIFWQLK